MLFEKLTDNDKKIITYWIKNYGPTNKGVPAEHYFNCEMAPLERIFCHWEWSKRELFHLLGDNLIISRDYCYEVPTSVLADNLSRELHSCNYVDDYIYLSNLYKKIVHAEACLNNARYALDSVWYIDNFVCNNIEHGFSRSYVNEMTFPDGKRLRLEPKMRPLKIIQRIFELFADKYDGSDWEDKFESIRLLISQVCNTKKLSGQLCLSIHPMDYMTMSDNDNKWGSCMRWRRNGEYSQGTIEMMNSPLVIVAYLHNPNNLMSIDKCDPESYWNNKKWRELFVVDSNVISEVKSYPYDDTNLSVVCLNWIKGLAAKFYGKTYEPFGFMSSCDEVTLTKDNKLIGEGSCDTSTFCGNEEEEDGTTFCIEFTTEYMYNDFGAMSRNHCAYINFDGINMETQAGNWNYTINYSGEAQCMWCGDTMELTRDEDGEVNAEARVCDSCVRVYTCSECGTRYTSPDQLIWLEYYQMYVCPDCYERYISRSDVTEIEYFSRDLDKLSLIAGKDSEDEIVYLDLTECVLINLCEDVYDSVWKEYFTGEPEYERGWWTRRHYINADKCTDKGAKLFGYANKEELMEAAISAVKQRNDEIIKTQYAKTATIDIGNWTVFTKTTNDNWVPTTTATISQTSRPTTLYTDWFSEPTSRTS